MRVQNEECLLNVLNTTHGVKSRRGDGTFGERIPDQPVEHVPGFYVGRGLIATTEIGAECKILAKAMIKQIDRVMNDMRNQVSQFGKGTGSTPITVAIVGVNHADYAVGYEGDRVYRTGKSVYIDGAGKRKTKNDAHPKDEAAKAIERIERDVRPFYDEMVLLRYKATNDAPFTFQWVDAATTQRDYAASLVKISRVYEQRF